jgi:hypothetical protein
MPCLGISRNSIFASALSLQREKRHGIPSELDAILLLNDLHTMLASPGEAIAMAIKDSRTMSSPWGRRLLPAWIDKAGRETPNRVWASIPRSSDLKDGFSDLQYRHLVAAIDAAAWWIESAISRSFSFETVAYMGRSCKRALLLGARLTSLQS